MPNPAIPVPGTGIEAQWGANVVDRLVLVFPDVAARDAFHTTPEIGQVCYVESRRTLQSHNGSAWFDIGTGYLPLGGGTLSGPLTFGGAGRWRDRGGLLVVEPPGGGDTAVSVNATDRTISSEGFLFLGSPGAGVRHGGGGTLQLLSTGLVSLTGRLESTGDLRAGDRLRMASPPSASTPRSGGVVSWDSSNESLYVTPSSWFLPRAGGTISGNLTVSGKATLGGATVNGLFTATALDADQLSANRFVSDGDGSTNTPAYGTNTRGGLGVRFSGSAEQIKLVTGSVDRVIIGKVGMVVDLDMTLEGSMRHNGKFTAGGWTTTTNSGKYGPRQSDAGSNQPVELQLLTSSREYKDDIRPIDVDAEVDRLRRLPLRSWKSKADGDDKRRRYVGVVKEELDEIDGWDGSEDISNAAVVPLVAAVQSLLERVEELEAKVEACCGG